MPKNLIKKKDKKKLHVVTIDYTFVPHKRSMNELHTYEIDYVLISNILYAKNWRIQNPIGDPKKST
jgi:hypothetical protein